MGAASGSKRTLGTRRMTTKVIPSLKDDLEGRKRKVHKCDVPEPFRTYCFLAEIVIAQYLNFCICKTSSVQNSK